MWWILQILIIFAVVASNIRWQWTPNGYLAGLYGVMAAWLLTWGLTRLSDVTAQWLGRPNRPPKETKPSVLMDNAGSVFYWSFVATALISAYLPELFPHTFPSPPPSFLLVIWLLIGVALKVMMR